MESSSISIIIPTKNSKKLLQKHIKDLVDISNYATETIVVDSSDTIETIDFLKQNLPELTTRYLSVPPGLYQAWNTAIKEAKADYVYIATSGDRIDLSNFKQLYSAAIKLDADVTISAPTFVDEEGRPLKKEWPIHLYLKNEECKVSSIIPESDVSRYNILLFPTTLIGSSASNIYKSSFLKENLFPIDCGMQGDSVWAAMHCFDARWALEPNCSSNFVIHEKDCSNRIYNRDLMDQQLSKVISYVTENRLKMKDTEKNIVWDYFSFTEETFAIREQLKVRREKLWWILNVNTWKLRKKYKARKKTLNEFVKLGVESREDVVESLRLF